MLSPTELRIGNCVKDHTGTIRFISHRKLSDIASNPDNHGYEPIPLAPEILEACGYTKDSERYDGETGIYCLDHKANYRIEIHHEEDQHLFIIAIFDDGDFSFLPNHFRFVHQFQNIIYWLTGSELSVNIKEKV